MRHLTRLTSAPLLWRDVTQFGFQLARLRNETDGRGKYCRLATKRGLYSGFIATLIARTDGGRLGGSSIAVHQTDRVTLLMRHLITCNQLEITRWIAQASSLLDYFTWMRHNNDSPDKFRVVTEGSGSNKSLPQSIYFFSSFVSLALNSKISEDHLLVLKRSLHPSARYKSANTSSTSPTASTHLLCSALNPEYGSTLGEFRYL